MVENKNRPPKLSKLGFKIIKCPIHVLNPILEYYEYLKTKPPLDEPYELVGDMKLTTFLYPLGRNPKFINWVSEQLKPIHENWVNKKLNFETSYGVRSYRKNSIIPIHTEHPITHQVSSIIVLDKSLKGNLWPLEILGHDLTLYKINLEIGDMILYEGSLCKKARSSKFLGEYFDEVYMHYSLE